jgi:hypothetical protein
MQLEQAAFDELIALIDELERVFEQAKDEQTLAA